jgi:hypothetical protein
MWDTLLNVVATEYTVKKQHYFFQVQSGKSLQTLVGLSGGLAHELPSPLR